ncbi:hypothetical protein B0F90DRAFT_1738083 [Multifurca ochricompacta]|uniref:Uncharacterized protein n=1 Tax=Multifurca ochricompacta TaxID=376703 RepID=A0AAD4QLY2_9AGAM|nr:hypothetical protein B0F90DRAFT_1738083 [Multifurca ochricompacta]
MSRTTLRPCLKHRTDLDPPAPTNSPLPFALYPSSDLGPRVHFPPTPGLCQTHLTHSSAIYDRAPIVVLPNACALPERNGRTYPPPSESPACQKKRRSTQAAQGVVCHSQVFTTASNNASSSSSSSSSISSGPPGRLPSLVPDFSSSESDESDMSSTPPEPTHFPSTGYPPISLIDSASDLAFSFLPHANEHEKARRERSRSRSRGISRSIRKSEFAIPELDGCLGGF